MARKGAEVTLYLRRGEGRMNEWARSLGILGVEGLRLAPFRWSREARWPIACRLAARTLVARASRGGGGRLPAVYIRQIELYSLHVARLARRLSLPLIYEAHNLKSLLVEESEGPLAAEPWAEMERAIFGSASGVVFTHPLTERFARERLAFHGPSIVARNAAPLVRAAGGVAPGGDRTARPPAPGPGGPIDILYVGQLYRWKGIDLLLASLSHLAGRRLVVAGGAAASDLDRSRQLARDLGVADRVEFLGQVPPDSVPDLMARARVGVVPLTGEGSIEASHFTAPLKLFEFWAAGVPVVASDLPSLRCLVRDGQNALLAPPRPREIAGAIARLLDDADLSGRIARAGQEEARSYTWEDRASAILDFIGRIAP